MKRRTLLKAAAGLSLIIGLPYSLWRGLRYPRLSWEPAPLPSEINNGITSVTLKDCFQPIKEGKPIIKNNVVLRAYAPEPSIIIKQAKQSYTLSINNVAKNTTLISNVELKETVQGITRTVSIPKTDQAIELKWQLPEMDSFNFTAIGDSGGNRELEWCIKRAVQLNSQFFLHLGDLNYAEGDYEGCIELFNNAPIPCYVTPGNHDFNDSGIVIDKFLNEIGPMNNSFALNGVKFINLDTAASFLPIKGGLRSEILEEMINDKTSYNDSVLFTHRPFYDPRPGEDHDLGNESERDWLIESLKKANVRTALFGHVHIFDDTVFKGIRSIIAGEGLANSDLIAQRQVSKIILGIVKKGQKVDYIFEELAMPLEYHCHPRVDEFRQKHPDHPAAKKLAGLCPS
jgi:hypothetical protein